MFAAIMQYVFPNGALPDVRLGILLENARVSK